MSAQQPQLHLGPLPLDPRRLQAWERIQKYLDDYLNDAQRLEQYISEGTDYAKLIHGTVPYTVNMLYIVGGRGSGKSTHLATLFYLHRHAILHGPRATPPCCPNTPPPKPVHLPVDILDPSVIPEDDHLVAWLAQAYKKLIDLLDEINKQIQRVSYEEIEKLQEAYNQFERSLYLLPVNHTELLKTLVAEIDDYIAGSREALNAGYSLAKNYVNFSKRLRETAGKLLENRGDDSESHRLILLGFDDVDMAPKRYIEIIVLCKLLSLDPYTLCIVTTRTLQVLYKIIMCLTVAMNYDDTSICASVLQSTNITANDLFNIANHVAANIQSKLFLPSRRNIVQLEPFKPTDILSYPCRANDRECTAKTLGKLIKSSLIEYIVRRPVETSRENLAYTIYAKRLLRYPRCLEGLYSVVHRLSDREARGKEAVEALRDALASCAADMEYAQLQDVLDSLRDDIPMIIETRAMHTTPFKEIGDATLELVHEKQLRVRVVAPAKLERREALGAAAISDLYYLANRRVAIVKPGPHIYFSIPSSENENTVYIPAPPMGNIDSHFLLAATLTTAAEVVATNLDPYREDVEYTTRLLILYPLVAHVVLLSLYQARTKNKQKERSRKEDRKQIITLDDVMKKLHKSLNIAEIVTYIDERIGISGQTYSAILENTSARNVFEHKKTIVEGLVRHNRELYELYALVERTASAIREYVTDIGGIQPREAIELRRWLRRYRDRILDNDKLPIPWHARIIIASYLRPLLEDK